MISRWLHTVDSYTLKVYYIIPWMSFIMQDIFKTSHGNFDDEFIINLISYTLKDICQVKSLPFHFHLGYFLSEQAFHLTP